MNEMDEYSRRRLSAEEIHRFITGDLSIERRGQIEMILKSSREDFEAYISLREALYLLGSGPKPSISQEKKILGMMKKNSGIPHIQISIKSFLDKILVSSSDQENLEFQGIMTDFAFRGSEPGPITITRKINGNQITLTFVPTPSGDGYSLDVSMSLEEELSVLLLVENEEWEVIRDIRHKSIFESILPLQGSLDLKFKKKGQIQFSIGIILHNEREP